MRHALKQPKGEKHLIIFRSDITEFGLKTGIFVKKRILHYLKTAMKKVLIVKNFLSISKEKKEKKNIYYNF